MNSLRIKNWALRTAQDSDRFAQYLRGVFRLSTFYVGGQKVNLWSQLPQQPNTDAENRAGVPTVPRGQPQVLQPNNSAHNFPPRWVLCACAGHKGNYLQHIMTRIWKWKRKLHDLRIGILLPNTTPDSLLLLYFSFPFDLRRVLVHRLMLDSPIEFAWTKSNFIA